MFLFSIIIILKKNNYHHDYYCYYYHCYQYHYHCYYHRYLILMTIIIFIHMIIIVMKRYIFIVIYILPSSPWPSITIYSEDRWHNPNRLCKWAREIHGSDVLWSILHCTILHPSEWTLSFFSRAAAELSYNLPFLRWEMDSALHLWRTTAQGSNDIPYQIISHIAESSLKIL